MKKTETSIARKVLCSALSATMVVAFAPAVGAAVGNNDGVAYAAEGENGQEGLIDISGVVEQGDDKSNVYYFDVEKLWNDHLNSLPKVKLIHNDEFGDPADIQDDCYTVHYDKLYQRSGTAGNYTYTEVQNRNDLGTGTYCYIKVTGNSNKGYTGYAYAKIRVADSKNLGEYSYESYESSFWSDEALEAPEVTLFRKIGGQKEVLDKSIYAADENKIEKVGASQGSYITIPQNRLLNPGGYYIAICAKNGSGYHDSISVFFYVHDADNIDNYGYRLSNWELWSDEEAKIPEVILRRGWKEDSAVVSKDEYAVSDKWFIKTINGSGEEEETYAPATLNDGKLAPGEYYIEVKLKKEGAKPRYIDVTVLDASDIDEYDCEVDGPTLWSDSVAKIPSVKLSRHIGDGWEYLDAEKYTVDSTWYTKAEDGETYSAVTPADGKLAAGTYYIKVTMGEKSHYAPVTVNDANDVSSYSFNPEYDQLWTDTEIKIPNVTGEREVDGRTEKLDASRYTVDRENLYVFDDDGEITDINGDKYSVASKSSDGKLAAGEYFVKVTTDDKTIMCSVLLNDATDISGYWVDDSGEDGRYSGDKAVVPALALVRSVNGERQTVDNTGNRVFTTGKLMTLKPGSEDGEPSDENLDEYTKATLDAGIYYVKLTGNTTNGYKGVKFVSIDVLDNYDLRDYYAWVAESDIWSDHLPSISSLKVKVNRQDDSITLDSSAYTIDASTWYTYDEGSEEYKKCDTLTAGGSYYVKITGKSPYKGERYAHVWIKNAKDLGDYSTDVPAEVNIGASAADVAAQVRIFRETNGKEEVLTRGTDYVIEDTWYRETEEPEGYEALQGNPTEAGTYYLKAVPASGSSYTGVAYLSVMVGNPCEKGHVLRKIEASESTCTEHGHKAYWYCEKCNRAFSDAEGKNEIKDEDSLELPLAAHTEDGGTTVSAATCTVGGKVEYRCKKCGAVTRTTTTAALGHSFSSGSISWTGGGVSSATGTFTCSRDSSHKETVAASISKTLTVKPTCTAKGTNTYTATAISSTGAKVTSTKTVQDEPALGHAYGPYTITVQPTTVSTGVATAKCTHAGCTSTITKTVEKLKSEQKTSVGGSTSATATVTDAKPATTPNGTNVVGSVTIDSVTAPASATKVEIPETVTVNGAEYAVTAIDAKAIAGNAKLESVKLPATVTELPAGLFEGCSALKEATLPAKVTEIPADTFNGTALASIAVPATVTKVGARAFKGTELASVELPASVASVGKDAFKGCDKLVTATLPAALKAVPAGAFDGCASLRGIALSGTVKPLAATATVAPATVDVSSATTIGANAFRGCKSVTAVDASKAKTIGAGALKGASKLVSLKTGSGLKSIGTGALSGAKKLKTLSVTSKKLSKSGVKGALKGSAVKTVKVAVAGSKATKAKYVAKYKKIFAAKNSGKKVNVK